MTDPSRWTAPAHSGVGHSKWLMTSGRGQKLRGAQLPGKPAGTVLQYGALSAQAGLCTCRLVPHQADPDPLQT